MSWQSIIYRLVEVAALAAVRAAIAAVHDYLVGGKDVDTSPR